MSPPGSAPAPAVCSTSDAPRLGLVLGAGGVLGGAWMAGALAALQQRLERPFAEFDLIVGTSAGSLVASQLRCGMTADEVLDTEHDPATLPGRRELDRQLQPWLQVTPTLGLGSPRMLLAAAASPWSVRPLAVATAMIPRSRRRLDPVARTVNDLLARSGERTDGTWPCHPTWVVATDYDTGRRTVFGQPASRPAPLAEAVRASCSVPGWFAPVEIGERTYVDGGVCSTTSLDLVRDARLDHVYVLAPLASTRYDNPLSPVTRSERVLRRVVTGQLLREARLIRSTGTPITLLTPGPHDLQAIGPNVMDPRHRAHVATTAYSSTHATLRDTDSAAAR